MTRALSYPAPSLRAVRSDTPTRREDEYRGTLWTDREVTFLIAKYRLLGPTRCARALRRSEMAVRIKAHRMGLSGASTMTIADIVSRFTASNDQDRAAS